jgi:ParB family chromosome partitioning protein
VSQNLSVRDTEALVKNYQESLKPETSGQNKGQHLKFKNSKKGFTNYFGSKVDVKVAGNGKEKITIPFQSEDDFNRIMELIKDSE